MRDCYTRDGRRTIVVTDRISAFDVVLGTIPFKGQVLNQMAAYWFEATDHLAPNHVIDVPDPKVTVAGECELLPVEFVMRSYLTGVTQHVDLAPLRAGRRAFSAATSCPTACARTSGWPSRSSRRRPRRRRAATTSRCRASRSWRWAR